MIFPLDAESCLCVAEAAQVELHQLRWLMAEPCLPGGYELRKRYEAVTAIFNALCERADGAMIH